MTVNADVTTVSHDSEEINQDNLNLFHVVRDFRPWDVHADESPLFYNLRTLQVKHAKGTKIENEALNNVLSSLRPMDENPGRHG